MYMDLVYIPNHCSAKNVDAEFFKRVRSSYYVVSGNDQTAQEPSRDVLDALLEGKAHWGNNLQVCLKCNNYAVRYNNLTLAGSLVFFSSCM